MPVNKLFVSEAGNYTLRPSEDQVFVQQPAGIAFSRLFVKKAYPSAFL